MHLTLLDRRGKSSERFLVPIDIKNWVKSFRFAGDVFRYKRASIKCVDLRVLPYPLKVYVFLWLHSPLGASISDDFGTSIRVGILMIFREAWAVLLDALSLAEMRYELGRRIDRASEGNLRKIEKSDIEGPVLYLRSDHIFDVSSGGSVAHISGVINSFQELSKQPNFLSTAPISMVSDNIPMKLIRPKLRYRDFKEVPAIAMGLDMPEYLEEQVDLSGFRFIYQRHSYGNFAGVELAEKMRVPLVLEFNGSEVWIRENWGHGSQYAKICTEIEALNLSKASLIVVVSQVLADQLVGRGVVADKILVNPNGVDPERFAPSVDGSKVRAELGFEKEVVFGFLGTFGLWHGAEVLASAFLKMCQQDPQLAARVRLLMIGDGNRAAATREIIEGSGFESHVCFTGMIPQHLGPEYLAVCDVLVAPHVPNTDGSRFFGSPTKLFEYMAMAKPIIASNLDQIGEVLGDDCAILVSPGDEEDLSRAMARVAPSVKDFQHLGDKARSHALERHTWRRHTERILNKMSSLASD